MPEVGFWPKDMLEDTSVGIVGGGPLPLEPPYRFERKGHRVPSPSPCLKVLSA